MTIDRKTFIVVNPNSANGSTRREWAHMEEAIRAAIGPFEWNFTSGPKDATRLTREAVYAGYDQIVAVGGDGTNNEVVNGFFDGQTPLNPNCAFAFICRGTGGDFRKTFGWTTRLEEAIERIKNERTRAIDLGRFTYIGHDGRRALSHFINITSFGIGGLVDRYVNASSKALGGKLSFMIATVRAVAAYSPRPVRLTIDDGEPQELRIVNVAVANGRFFGGGMMIAPQAEPDDGLFDIVVLGDLTKWEIISGSGDVYKGAHLSQPKISHMRGRKVTAESDQEVLIDMDGEAPGRLPCEFEILPRVLPLKA
ncbi:MAG: diacylglycerol kinase family lipid kinase [Myxococcales bacterium]|nr:MAG: diacylglycerol kinase family lipid kinase [Myxococcales bacterium]